MIETQVLIVGGGPVGLVLALELEQRGVSTVLVERNPTMPRCPRADVASGRSLEHFRRLGIADEIRAHAMPVDHPMDVVWCSRLAEWELARFPYPTPGKARGILGSRNDGSQPLEPRAKIPQLALEKVLTGALERPGTRATPLCGWELDSFEEDADGVHVTIRSVASGDLRPVRTQYLVGCDGAESATRKGLGLGLEIASTRDLLRGMRGGSLRALASLGRAVLRGERRPDGRLYLVHFRSGERAFFDRFGAAWRIQSPVGGTLIAENGIDTWTLHVPLQAGADASTLDPKQIVSRALGRELACEILAAQEWTPRLAVAESYGRGRVWLAGDAAHQMVPPGSHGLNTGIGDAVDLGWKLAAVLQGWGGDGLLPSYEAERRPIGRRNRDASAGHLSIRMQIAAARTPLVHEDSPRGEAARDRLRKRILELGNLEDEAVGIDLGDRYDGSPAVAGETGEPPAWSMASYVASTWPGSRPPSVILEDGRGIFDLFGPGFTLVRFADLPVERFVEAARLRGMPLWVVDVRDRNATRIYERGLVLIRPDQHVAWRGDETPDTALEIVDRVRGAGS